MSFKISIKKKKRSNKPLPEVDAPSVPVSSSSSKPVDSTYNFEVYDDYVVLTQERDSYEGERNWRHQKHGYGVYYYDNGDVFDGNWVDGKKHGQGTYYYASGETLHGYFTDDKFHEGIKITKKGKKCRVEPNPAKKLNEDDDKLDGNIFDPNLRFNGSSEKVESMRKKEATQEEIYRKREEMVKKMREKYGIPEKSGK